MLQHLVCIFRRRTLQLRRRSFHHVVDVTRPAEEVIVLRRTQAVVERPLKAMQVQVVDRIEWRVVEVEHIATLVAKVRLHHSFAKGFHPLQLLDVPGTKNANVLDVGLRNHLQYTHIAW